ncbi:dihydrodipicolinate synthase family protein [Cohnella fermenti]|uniref:Dihydrodipicolinate synthase family protein n=2 Tax=Cohnella fermenti TaxID=2565925 RepID=A0A4S4BIK1_9BACL|nr:dihydrodipicolinate synthase family protein [Cohnella fermenti]
MKAVVPQGVWPTMITPFRDNLEIDYGALAALIEWYKAAKVDGLFAVCQSSEMFFLSLEERVLLASFVVSQANGELPVIASGHVSERLEDQIAEIEAISATGIDVFVLLTNRLAKAEESDEVWRSNAERILAAFPDQQFGLYECPYPYKRLLSTSLLEWCASTGRFLFIKDTCCNVGILEERLRALKGTPLQLFNANSATLLDSLRLGAAGFSGVMANFHPDLYVWLTRNWQVQGERAERLQAFLGTASLIELQMYPINAKHSLQLEGLPLKLFSRTKDYTAFDPHARLIVSQLGDTAAQYRGSLLDE